MTQTPTLKAPRIRSVVAALLSAGFVAAAAAGPTLASSPDAWEGLRQQVAAACQKLALDRIEMPVVTVDPFGSESFGLALVRGKAKGGDAYVTSICVYDKQRRTVELGSDLSDDVVRGANP
ncbi:hypothetical protein SAMN05880582_107116 [Rhizobium sp. RU20A]|uniref:hypothetical protein n=1 Tax=Rhizobium sp. RU20A TaxID=1907412 RepID=UPI0009552C30|nr:hypothetical protein [Rhizobium sp. RU20A]SIR17291.1 hypothetical protein SAMN05880582_107116 [Rhizobium sp. RU20A]